MKFKAFLNKISTEEVTIEAETTREAMAQLRKLSEESTGASSAVLRVALIDGNGGTDLDYGIRFQQKEHLAASPFPEPTANAMHGYFLDELVKRLSVVEALAHCSTTKDRAIEQERDVEEVLASRDYVEEYEAFMNYILFARRAMNLPDVLSEVGEDGVD